MGFAPHRPVTDLFYTISGKCWILCYLSRFYNLFWNWFWCPILCDLQHNSTLVNSEKKSDWLHCNLLSNKRFQYCGLWLFFLSCFIICDRVESYLWRARQDWKFRNKYISVHGGEMSLETQRQTERLYSFTFGKFLCPHIFFRYPQADMSFHLVEELHVCGIHLDSNWVPESLYCYANNGYLETWWTGGNQSWTGTLPLPLKASWASWVLLY